MLCTEMHKIVIFTGCRSALKAKLQNLQKELKGVGSTPIRSSISTLSSNSNYSSVIGVGGTLQFRPKELEWSPNLHIHSRSGPVSASHTVLCLCPWQFRERNSSVCSNFDLIFENDESDVGYVSEHNADLQKRLNSDIGVDVEEAAPGTKVSNWEEYGEVK